MEWFVLSMPMADHGSGRIFGEERPKTVQNTKELNTRNQSTKSTETLLFPKNINDNDRWMDGEIMH